MIVQRSTRFGNFSRGSPADGHARAELISRRTLARYATLLDHGSIAAQALAEFDTVSQDKGAPKVVIGLEHKGFTLTYVDGVVRRFGC